MNVKCRFESVFEVFPSRATYVHRQYFVRSADGFFALRQQTHLDIAQTFPISQLCKDQGAKLFRARERAHPSIALVPLEAALKCCPRQKIHQLGEQSLAGVHRSLSRRKPRKQTQIGIFRSSRHHPKNIQTQREISMLQSHPSSSTGH